VDKDDDDASRRPISPVSPILSPRGTDYCPGPHPSRRPMVVYCRDCDGAMCEGCFIQQHNGHRHATVDEMALELRDRLKDDCDRLTNVANEHAKRLNTVQVWECILFPPPLPPTPLCWGGRAALSIWWALRTSPCRGPNCNQHST